jgi:pimeloyl-ACP methyl ester carboxylesterase
MRAIAVLIVFAFLATGNSAFAGPPPAYFVDETKLPFDEVPGLPSQRLWGVLNGAGYRIEVPANWNGSLVMWAHGYRGTGLELTVDNHPLRSFLLAQGYAWAASSYSRNAYDPSQGANDTHALTQFFNGKFGKPRRTYVTGASMGGHVTAVVAEQWAQSYDGAMPICGVLGDYELFDYFADFSLSAQTLSGVGATFPYGADYLTATVPATKAALGPAFPFVLNASGQNLAALTQLRSGGVRPIFEQGWLYWNGLVPGDFLFGLSAGTDGTLPRQPGQALDNSDVVYQFDTNPALSAAETVFDASVQRLVADPQARRRNGIANVMPTTGNLRIPMVTLHTLGDLFVPFHMEQEYARRVATHGASDLLVQRATRDVGHCSFTPRELVQTFVALVTWVEAGVKPEGDDVLDPAVVADPNYGCKFTDKAAPRIWDNPAWVFPKPTVCPAN